MPTIPDPLEANFNDLSINDFIVQMQYAADKQEKHPAFQGDPPEYVTIASRLREMATELGQARDAAAGGDRNKIAEKNALWTAGKMALSVNAHHIVLLSLHRNDPSLLLDSGYEHKQKNNGKAAANLLDLTPDVFAKHGTVSGCLSVLAKRHSRVANIELQITDQDPTVESSWNSLGMYTKSRIEVRGLEPAKRIHFRARYHVEGSAGKWSSTVSIIVL